MLQRMIARNSRTKPQTAGSLVSQAVASLRHWVSANDLYKIKSSGIPTLVVSSKYPVSFLPLDDTLLFCIQCVHRSLSLLPLFTIHSYHHFPFFFSLVMDWILFSKRFMGQRCIFEPQPIS